MRYLLAITALFTVLGSGAFGQIKIDKGETKKCYEKNAADKGKRFVEWQCGKIAGVIDCNEKLEYDEGSKVLFSASSGSPFSGTCETCHQNGVLEHRITFINGKENGIDTTYYASGCIMVIRDNVLGKENGLWTYYNDSTQTVAWKMNYLNGEKHGFQVFIDPKKGDTTLYENYKNGVLHGVKKSYYVRTKAEIDANPGQSLLERSSNYVNGLLDGPFNKYNREGKLLQSVNYKAGKKNGVSTYYYDDGVLLRTENWSMDAKNGEFKTFYYQQTIQSVENYRENKKKVKVAKLDAEIYECQTKDMADEVYNLLTVNKLNLKQVIDKINSPKMRTYKDRFDTLETAYLQKVKIVNGVNPVYESGKRFYVVNSKGFVYEIPAEIKEGWFEERYPDQKPKRRALYKNNVLVEEHIFNDQGKETYTFGASSSKGAEDDAMPTTKKPEPKKQKEAKPKKEKKKKGE